MSTSTLEVCHHSLNNTVEQLFTQHPHCSAIIINLEIVLNIWGDVHGLLTNTTTFHIWYLSTDIWIFSGVLEPIPYGF
jgi:hypothetical protein